MKKVILIFFNFLSILIFCQTLHFDKKINWKTINENTGILLVKTSDGFYGIDSKTEKIIWENTDLKKWKADSYQEIPLSPFIKFEKTPVLNSSLLSKTIHTKGKTIVLLDVTNGKTIFDSEENHFTAIFDFKIAPETKTIFIQGIVNKEFTYALYDYKAKKMRWSNSLNKSNISSVTKDQLKAYRGSENKVFADKYHNIFVLAHNFLVKLDSKTGKVLQKYTNTKNALYDYKQDLLILITSKLNAKAVGDKISIKAVKNGSEKDIWEKQPSIAGTFEQGFIQNDQLIITTSKGFNIINLKNGEKDFEKTPEFPLIKNIVPTEDGYAVAQGNWLSLIDKKGNKVWKKKQNIAHTATETPIQLIPQNNHLLFSSPSFSNVINLKTGQKIWKEDLHYQAKNFVKRNLDVISNQHYITKQEKEDLLVLNNTTFYILNPSISITPSNSITLDFKGEEPSISTIKTGYLVSSKNHYYAFNSKGNSLYTKHFNEKEKKSLVDKAVGLFETGYRIYGNTTSIITNQISNVSNYALMSGKFGFASSIGTFAYNNYNNVMGYMDTSKLTEYGDLSSSYEKVFSRGKSLNRLKEERLIALNRDSGTELISLNLNTGDTESVMKLNTETKEYLIDNIAQIMYIFNKKQVEIKKIP
ncbi:hypothetical protein UJ101_01503 [Flavobacteriaceae bacterium UJ101]|nr:hypothetical protein UJ101_01503 [Flavobacteriaceae bacterium UJ101]